MRRQKKFSSSSSSSSSSNNKYNIHDSFKDVIANQDLLEDRRGSNGSEGSNSFGSGGLVCHDSKNDGSDRSQSSSSSSPSSFSFMTIESKAVKRFMTTSNDRIQIPLGHNMLIANSKSKGAEKFYSRGRPIINLLAENLVDMLLSY